MKVLLPLLLLVALALPAAAAAAVPRPPATRVEPVTETLHGVAVTDPYRWLEGDDSNPQRMGQVTPEVAAWTDAQNAYTRAALDALPGRKALEDRLRPLLEVGAVTRPAIRSTKKSVGRSGVHRMARPGNGLAFVVTRSCPPTEDCPCLFESRSSMLPRPRRIR